MIQGKQKTSDFDVFLCYSKANRDAVISIGEQLKEVGLLPWLDEWKCGLVNFGKRSWKSRYSK